MCTAILLTKRLFLRSTYGLVAIQLSLLQDRLQTSSSNGRRRVVFLGRRAYVSLHLLAHRHAYCAARRPWTRAPYRPGALKVTLSIHIVKVSQALACLLPRTVSVGR